MNPFRIYLVICLVAVAIGTSVLYPILVPGSSAAPDSQLQEIVYIDTKSGELFLRRARTSPEINPDTGERTLIPGMYCAQCKAWKPVGPIETLQKNHSARNCPIHKTPLLREGPLPDELAE